MARTSPKQTKAKPRAKAIVKTASVKKAATASLVNKQAAITHDDGPRRVKTPRRKVYRRQDKRFRIRPKLPGAFTITKRAGQLLVAHWKITGGIVLVYGLLNILLVRGLNGGVNVGELKTQTDAVFHGAGGHVASGLTVFGLLLTSSNNVASAAASAYQTILLIIISLALVWTYRQLLAGSKVRIRDGFYRGMYPLIPVLLVLMVVGLEFLPLLLGGLLYVQLVQGGIAITGLEQFVSLLILLVLAGWSVYMLCSTTFALYVVTLPDMTPLKAMRSARELVRYRRWTVIRKLLFLPFMLLIVGALIMLPFILLAPILAQWMFFLLSMAALAAVHAYLYSLYRELLNE